MNYIYCTKHNMDDALKLLTPDDLKPLEFKRGERRDTAFILTNDISQEYLIRVLLDVKGLGDGLVFKFSTEAELIRCADLLMSNSCLGCYKLAEENNIPIWINFSRQEAH